MARTTVPLDPSIFKAYDVRGIYPEQLDESVAAAVVAALCTRWPRGSVVIGRDARRSSPALYRAAVRAAKTRAGKGRVIAAGLMTTPLFYFLVTHLRAAGGVMITASHNPKEYNGIKAVGANADPISGTELLRLVSASRFVA